MSEAGLDSILYGAVIEPMADTPHPSLPQSDDPPGHLALTLNEKLEHENLCEEVKSWKTVKYTY